jgi:hypothetical protein
MLKGCFVFKTIRFAFLLVLLAPPAVTFAQSTPASVSNEHWDTYTNKHFGFSVDYPVDENEGFIKPAIDPDEDIDSFLLFYRQKQDKVQMRGFKNSSLKKEDFDNALFDGSDSGSQEDAGWQFDFELVKRLRADLSLPEGSDITKEFDPNQPGYSDLKSCKVISVKGLKSIRLRFKTPLTGIFVMYFIPRGRDRWLKIDIFEESQPVIAAANPPLPFVTPSPQTVPPETPAEKAEEAAFLKYLKWFPPKP